ncbi:MAG: hypothetical protein ACE5G2_01265 [Candidatus Krumholzibacteriia bacterium]
MSVQRLEEAYAAPAWLDGIQRRALRVGSAGVVLSVIGAFASPEQFFRSYLVGFLFWVGIPLGCLGLSMLQHMTGGAWGLVARRIFEAASRTLPLLAVLFVPILFGTRELYVWARPEAVAGNELLQHKQPYLNEGFFIGRSLFYFLVWSFFAVLLDRWSLQQDRTGDPGLHRRMQIWSALGLVAYTLTASFAAFDWLMSLDPFWFSSIYGFHFIVGQVVAAFCFHILVSRRLMMSEPMSRVFAARHFDDYGKLLLCFVLLWVYMTFSQYLVIWSGNLPEEITWYLHRRGGGYRWWGVLVLALHFGLPFFLLMSRALRRNPKALALLAVPVLLSHGLDVYWQAVPSIRPDGLALHWLDLVVPIGIGGVWIAAFVRELKKRALLPIHDPRLEEAIGDA